jgi:hypothetical protein
MDSFLKYLVHMRPHLVGRFEEFSEAWIDAWLEAGGANTLDAMDPIWLDAYLEGLADGRGEAEQFFQIFYAWAIRENLLDASPLA